MLGPFADARLSEAAVRLEPCEALIVYTDGGKAPRSDDLTVLVIEAAEPPTLER
jgi:hypothetical protein